MKLKITVIFFLVLLIGFLLFADTSGTPVQKGEQGGKRPHCDICIKKSPCTAVEDILKDSALRPDCYACNICVETCPENVLTIGIKKSLEP